MAQWGKNDEASNSVFWAVQQLKQKANSDNRDALFDNTTPDAYFDGVTIGQYGVDDNEIAAGGGAVSHTGWVLRTEGSGGRAGRVFNEVLVAGNIVGDASDDAVFPDYTLRIVTNPANASGNATANQSKTFSVVGASTPSGASLSYLWYYSTDGSSYSTTVAQSGFSGQTTGTLTVNSAVVAANVFVKARISTTGAASVNSAAAKLTVTV